MNQETLKFPKHVLADALEKKVQRLEVLRNDRLTKFVALNPSAAEAAAVSVKVLCDENPSPEYVEAAFFLKEAARLEKQIKLLKTILISYTALNDKQLIELEEITTNHAEYIFT